MPPSPPPFSATRPVGPRWQTSTVTDTAITDGRYLIRNVGSCLLLEVADGSRRSGARVRQGADDGSDAQLWQLTAVHPGGALCHLENVASGKRLDVAGASPDNGVPIQQWSANAFGAQEWLLEAHVDDPGTYTITSFISGKPLTAAAPPDRAVHQWEDTDSPTQWWRFERRG
ncbi:RICIN domain-containing protein [Kitasatospora sp. NPDC087861]|uniref:RICIN domain-containing protein n=1 Tax=Kitasatospora sp. NPDC087861 TaxID=3364070 RepID=UPI00382F9188